MSVITELTLPARDFVLSRALRADAGIAIELEPVVPTTNGRFPSLIAWDGSGLGSFEDAAAGDPAIDRIVPVDVTDAGVRYRVHWSDDRTRFARCLADTDATLLDGSGRDQRWRFEVRFPDNECLTRFQRRLREEGIQPNVTRVYTPTELRSDRRYDLTAIQRETLVTAFEAGYFNEPRDLSLGELATRLDVSTGAAVGRLRRGLSRLIADTVAADREGL